MRSRLQVKARILSRPLLSDSSFLISLCLCPESVCPTRIPVASRDEKGFELLVGMKVHTKAKKISGSLVSEAAYALTTSTDITENTRWRLLSTSIQNVFQFFNSYCRFSYLQGHFP